MSEVVGDETLEEVRALLPADEDGGAVGQGLEHQGRGREGAQGATEAQRAQGKTLLGKEYFGGS